MDPQEGVERRAIVVDDDTDIRELLAQVLAMQGFSVQQAATGREAVELVREHDPDLVTLDLGLPDMDGTEVCRRVREITDAYIIMVTARKDEIDRLIGLEIGADDYISKPFSPREVQARVTAMFRRPRRTVAPTSSAPQDDGHQVLTHGPLVVDVDGRVAVVDGKELTLTRTEFDILVTLMSGPKRVWAREVLLRDVWGTEWSTDHHLVEVHVGNLRRKLGDTGRSSRFIRTVRGVGYKMEPPEAIQSGEPADSM